MERGVQTRLDDFYQRESNDQREALRRIHETHVTRLSKVFNEAFGRIFNQLYIVRCDE